MPIYTIIHGVPDEMGKLTRFAIVTSFSNRDKAFAEFNRWMKQVKYTKIGNNRYINEDTGEHYTIHASLVF